MLRARKLGVLTPCVLCVEHEASTIYFERVAGISVKQALHDGALQPEGARPAHACLQGLPRWKCSLGLQGGPAARMTRAPPAINSLLMANASACRQPGRYF